MGRVGLVGDWWGCECLPVIRLLRIRIIDELGLILQPAIRHDRILVDDGCRGIFVPVIRLGGIWVWYPEGSNKAKINDQHDEFVTSKHNLEGKVSHLCITFLHRDKQAQRYPTNIIIKF